MLWQRGLLLTKAAMAKVVKIDEKINQYKTDHKYDLSRPIAAFITFET